jgi:DNA-directed RNA polymerase specialized sigma24 family protein
MIDNALTDEALLVAARTDAEAFTRFYRRHAAPVLRYLVRRTRDPELGADLTAETFACALEGLARFDPERGSAVNWLFGIARHQLLHTLQRGKVERRARDRLGMPRIELDDEDLERILALDEQEYDAIARSSGTAEATIRKRVSRALDSLRNTLGGQP